MKEETKTDASISSRGGKASAAKLTAAQRRERAKMAAEARWGANLPKATHGSPDHPLKIGSVEIPCYVLEDGTRVITNRGLQRCLGMSQSGGAQRLVNIVGVFEDKGIDCKDLTSRIENPIGFRIPGIGSRAFGFEATVLADLCDAILAARKAGLLQRQQEHIADSAEILMRSFARVGIIALIDEATGYQYNRARDDLHRILEQYVSKELARWEKTFDADFYKHMHRLKGWAFDPSGKRSHAVARLTVDLTYDRIHPDLLAELKQVREEKGRPSHKLHRWLTTGDQGGHPRLKQHLEGVGVLMKVAKDWDQFKNWVDQHYPKYNETPRLPFPEPEEDGTPDKPAED